MFNIIEIWYKTQADQSLQYYYQNSYFSVDILENLRVRTSDPWEKAPRKILEILFWLIALLFFRNALLILKNVLLFSRIAI